MITTRLDLESRASRHCLDVMRTCIWLLLLWYIAVHVQLINCTIFDSHYSLVSLFATSVVSSIKPSRTEINHVIACWTRNYLTVIVAHIPPTMCHVCPNFRYKPPFSRGTSSPLMSQPAMSFLFVCDRDFNAVPIGLSAFPACCLAATMSVLLILCLQLLFSHAVLSQYLYWYWKLCTCHKWSIIGRFSRHRARP